MVGRAEAALAVAGVQLAYSLVSVLSPLRTIFPTTGKPLEHELVRQRQLVQYDVRIPSATITLALLLLVTSYHASSVSEGHPTHPPLATRAGSQAARLPARQDRARGHRYSAVRGDLRVTITWRALHSGRGVRRAQTICRYKSRGIFLHRGVSCYFGQDLIRSNDKVRCFYGPRRRCSQ